MHRTSIVLIAAAIRARERRIAQRTGVIRTRVKLLEGGASTGWLVGGPTEVRRSTGQRVARRCDSAELGEEERKGGRGLTSGVTASERGGGARALAWTRAGRARDEGERGLREQAGASWA